MVQLKSQEESFTETMPPVTTLPENGSRLQIYFKYSLTRASSVSTVALIQYCWTPTRQNISG